MNKAVLVLEDGVVLEGEGFGALTTSVFELVFNTSMTGYQEILSDPSYRGQGVLLTTSHVGNVGINDEDLQSFVPQATAVILRALSGTISNWRSQCGLADWLKQANVPGIQGVDTRWLTRKLRDQGTLKAALSTDGTPSEQLLAMAREWPGLDGRDMVGEVSCREVYSFQPDAGSHWIPAARRDGYHVVAFDFGIKTDILRQLTAGGARVTVVPAYTTYEAVLALNPDGVFLSNGPGDPAGLPGIVAVVSRLIESGLPVFGICLGHQLIGRALGGETSRLKFGHHSGNHPVQFLPTGKVWVTAQNHNYAVVAETLDAERVEPTHISLNDHTLEGMRLRNCPVFSVQFHPESAPGPHDAYGLFDQFFKLMEEQHA